MGNAILNVVGFLLIIMGMYSFMNPAYPVNFISHEYRTMDILTIPTNNSTYSFNFTPGLIYKYYEKLDSGLQYNNFVDIYVEDFLDNSSINAISSVKLNDDIAIPANKSYLYSFEVRESSLKDFNTLELNKTAALNIDKIQLVYYGSDYQYYNTFKEWFRLMYLIIVLLGIILVLI